MIVRKLTSTDEKNKSDIMMIYGKIEKRKL